MYMQLCQVQHIHCYREGNALADFLANHAFEVDGLVQFHSFAGLPSQARKILNLDKAQVPNFIIKTRRIIAG